MIRLAALRSVFVLAAIFVLVLASMATPVFADGTVAGQKLRRLRAMLDETIDMQDFQAPMTLNEALSLIQDKLNAKYKEDDVLPILIDAEAFRKEGDENSRDVYDAQVRFPRFPRRMKAVTALKVVLSQIPSKNATFLLRGGFIEVTTVKNASLKRLLRQKVFTNFERLPLADAIEELSALTGVSVILDPRLGDKLKKPITAALNNDVPLEGVLRLLADMAEVKLFLAEDVIYVTSPANAENLEKERKARLRERWCEEDEARRRSGKSATPRKPAKTQPMPK